MTVYCKISDNDDGSDHLTITASFNIEISTQIQVERYLFKETSWQQIRETTSVILGSSPSPARTQEKCDRLVNAVTQAVRAHTLLAKPSPYAKRWWNKELTELREAQSRLRNMSRRLRGEGIQDKELEQAALIATRRYHEAIQCQKRRRWDKFVTE